MVPAAAAVAAVATARAAAGAAAARLDRHLPFHLAGHHAAAGHGLFIRHTDAHHAGGLAGNLAAHHLGVLLHVLLLHTAIGALLHLLLDVVRLAHLHHADFRLGHAHLHALGDRALDVLGAV